MNYCRLISILLFAINSLSVFAQSENKYIREGNEYYKRHNYKEAEKSYSRTLEKNKESLDAKFNMGDALYKQKKYEDAGHLFESLTKSTKDKAKLAQTYHNLGNCHLQNKKYEDCIQAYQNALKLNPKDEDTRYNLAYAKKKLEQQQNQNKQNNNSDKNKQQNQNQNSENKDQKKDFKKEDEKNQSKESKENEEQQQAQNQPQKMSKEDAKRLLEAMNNQEKDVQEKLKKKKAMAVKVAIEKDW